MSGTLQKHAEEVFDELPEAVSKEVVGKLFGALAKGRTAGRDVRGVMKLKDLCALTNVQEPEATTIIDAFRGQGRSFLRPADPLPLSGESLIEISCENLLHDWPRLRGWASQDVT